MRRDAAHFVSMLLGDQLLSIGDSAVPQQLEPIRGAYEHVMGVIEQALITARLLARSGAPHPELNSATREIEAQEARFGSARVATATPRYSTD